MNSNFSTYWRELANGTRCGLNDRLLIILLAPFSLIFSLIQRCRAILYRIGILKTRCLPRPVVSIGNITVGGTGKTPVTAYIARLLLDQGYRVVVLSRGYGGSLEGHTVVVSDGATVMLGPGECGDEPYLLASTIPGLMVVIGTDRFAAGELALQQLSPDLFLLDDGFQHLQLQRDLNILLLDQSHPFGNGWLLPAGLLREPASALQRADLVIHTRCRQEQSGNSPAVNIPHCAAQHRITGLMPLSGGNPVTTASLAQKKLIAFAGIAEPALFFDDLKNLGMNLVHTIRFSDHTAYSKLEIANIIDALHDFEAEFAITTEKDGVKLMGLGSGTDQRILLAHLDISIDDPAILTNRLRNLLQK